MSEINYPLWWLDPAYCPWADEYYDGDESLIDDDDDQDHFYVTNYGYPIHQGSM